MTWLLRRSRPALYRNLLRIPGARPLLWFGLVGRFPVSMYPVGLVFAGEAASGSYAVAGLATAGFGVASAVARPVSGRLIDRYGQRFMARLLLALFVASSGGLLAVLNFAPTAWLIVLLAVAAGLTVPNVGTLTRVRWVEMTERTDLERSQALEAVNDEVGFTVGPPAVSIIATTFTAWIPLLAATVLAAIGTLGVASLPGEPRVDQAERVRARGWITPPRLVLLGSLTGLGMVLGGGTVTVVAYTAELGQPAWAAVVFSLNAVGSLVAALIVGRMGPGELRDRYWKATLWLLAVMIPYGLVAGIGWFAVAGFVAGTAISPAFIQANSLVADTTPYERRTEAFSWVGAAAGMGIAFGSAITGYLVDLIGAGPARAWVIIFAALPAAMTFGLRRLEKRGIA